MKSMTKRISVVLLVICMIASLVLPAAALTVSDIPTTEIITTPSGYKSAADVPYPSSGYIANWGARGEIATFVSTKAADYYTSGNTYADLIQWTGSDDDTATGTDLYTALNALAVAQQHTITTYDGCRDLYGYTDCVLGDTTQLSLFYMGTMVSSTWDSGVTYNREHTWPKSKLTNQTSNDGADIMHIRPADSGVNSSRSNDAYGESTGYVDPGVSVRGDVARIALYMYVRWGNESNLWGTGGVFESLDVLLSWNAADPVDTWEMGRNDAIQSITGARNMFVDYPELAYYLFNKEVPANLVTPSSFTASDDNTGSDDPVGDGSTATLVTDVADLSIGDRIIIVTSTKNYAMGAQNGYYRDRVDITKSEDGATVTYGDTVQIITLGNGAVGGTYSLNVGDGYLYASSSDYNNLQTETALSANSSWKISITDGEALIEAVGENTRNTIQHNDSNPRFTCYGGATMEAVSIYTLQANAACAHSYTSQSVAATCAVEGYTKYTCSACGNFYYDSYTAKVDHNYVNGACSVCGVAEPGNNWIKVELSEITATDTIAITMTKDGTTWALFNGKGASAAPTAVVVEVSGNIMTSEDAASLSWNIVTDNDGMIIYVAGSTESWLYTTDTNNGTRVGNTTMHWVLDDATGYLKTVECASTRYLGVYTANPDWRSYKNTTGNTAGQTLSFWKLNVSSGDEECEHTYVGVATAPTCTEGGYTTYTCSKCNDVYVGDETEPAGHSFEASVTAPTCTEGGYTTDTCTVCGWYEKRDFVDPTGHTYTNGICSVCGDTEVTIDLSGKYYIATIRSAGGNYFYVEGAMNGTRYNAVDSGLAALPEAITAPQDNMVFVFVKNADGTYCIQVDGTENYLGWTSGNTGALVAQADALNVTVTVDNGAYLIHFTADDGVRYLSLNDTTYNYFAWYKDGQAKNLSLIPVAACQHNYSVETTPATCTEAGENVYTCSLCQHTYSEVISASGHSYVNGVCANCGEQEQAVTINDVTIDFSTTDQRTFLDTSAQIWANGPFTMTNNKANSTTNVADYSGPARFYKNSNLVFDCVNMSKLEITCNTEAYATALYGSISSDGTATVSVNGTVVTIEFVAPVDTYTINLTGGQVRADSVTAYIVTAAGHEHEYEAIVTAPTCTEQGYTTWSCSCGDSYVDSYVTELGHSWEPATCTDPQICSVCKATQGEPNGHNFIDGVCASCGEQEQTDASEYTIDFTTTDQRTAFSTAAQVWVSGGFTMTNNKASSTSNVADYSNPARFYAKSNLVFECANMNKLEITCSSATYASNLANSITADDNVTVTTNGSVVTIEFATPVDSYTIESLSAQVRVSQATAYIASAEAPHQHEYESVVTDPTCTEGGYTTYTCSVCGDSYVADEVDALGHTWNDATCTAPKTCSVCGETEGEALGHTWNDATCTAPKTCSVCGTTEGDALGHASYTYSYASGVHSFTCTLCGETVTMAATDSKKFAINSAAPVLSDDIVMKYSTTVPAGFEKPYMVFDFNGESFTISDYEVNATNGRYEYKFPGINPQKMGDNICATLYAFVDGVQVSVQIANYSMVKNCDNQLKKSTTDAKTRTMLSDVLMYGEKAQIVTGYKTDVLVTSLLSAASTLTPSTYPESLDASVDMQKRTGTKDDRVQFTGVTLSLGSKMAVRVAVTCTDTSLFTYKVTINDREYTYTGADLVPVNDGSDGKYYLFFNQMKATEFGAKISFTCWEGNTQISYTIEYSVYTFIYRNMSKVDANTQELLKAIYNYGESVK